jgi:hypothetical protein
MYNGGMDKKAQVLQRILDIELQFKNSLPKSTPAQWSKYNELYRMHWNIRLMYEELDRESVECRRLGKETTKYLEHYTKLSDSLDLLDQFIMTAIMMS